MHKGDTVAVCARPGLPGGWHPGSLAERALGCGEAEVCVCVGGGGSVGL